MAREKLFGQEKETLKWGIRPGEHVAHIITDDMTDAIEIPYNQPPETTGYNGVGQKEMYNNEADNATAEFFMEMAKQADEDYDSELCDDPVVGAAYAEVMECIKRYLTTGRRSVQQEELSKLKKAMAKCNAAIHKNYTLKEGDDPKKQERMDAQLNHLQILNDRLRQMTKGNLDHERNPEAPIPEEPNNTKSGAVGIWVKTDDELFPHEPSPNDIKQGYGVEDCFMLSVMAVKASKDPKSIKDMMKDNGDGTVTVRFYNRNKEPVYVDVQKSVNKGPAGNNVYASGSLWVQMLEKAYAKYCENFQEYQGYVASDQAIGKKGFQAIDRGASNNFLNAIEPDPKENYTQRAQTAGFFNEVYTIGKSGNSQYIKRDNGYLKLENELFKFYEKHINQEKEIMTVAADVMNREAPSFLKTHGIRTGHAYGVLKVFEQDGKKFVQVRDPYATFKAEYNKDGKLKANAYGGILAGLGTMMDGLRTGGKEDMGTFNLEFTDFLKFFPTFTGVKQSSAEELNQITLKNRKEFQDEIDERSKVYTKEEEQREIEEAGLTEDEKALYEKISEHPGYLEEELDNVSAELKCTDEFFTWPNSKSFNKMRDATYDMKKIFDNYSVEKFSPKQKIALCKKFTELANLADDYENKKIGDLKEKLEKNEVPSTRFVHRLTTATNLKMVARGGSGIKNWPGKQAEGMGLVLKDINTKMERAKNNEIQLKENDVTRMKQVAEIIEKTMAKNPKLQKQSGITTQEVEKAKSSCDDFEIVDDYVDVKDNQKTVLETDKIATNDEGEGVLTW